jgi:hypothetical protein
MFESTDKNIQDVKKEDSLTITDITPLNESELLKDNTNVEPFKPNEIIPVGNITVIKDNVSILNNCKQERREKRRKICLTCNTNIHSIVPICTWHQDRNFIYLKLNILEIDDFNLDSTMESIKFK